MQNSGGMGGGVDDNTLITQAVRGDADAFGILYIRYQSPIYRYILFKVGHPMDAEDLTEEVFVRAWVALPSFEVRETPFMSWLYRIAHNLVIDHHRKKQPLNIDEQSLLQRISPLMQPEARILQDEFTHQIVEALSKLSEIEQQVIVLRFVEEMSHREVSELVGKSEGACRVIQHRALSAMHGYLRTNHED